MRSRTKEIPNLVNGKFVLSEDGCFKRGFIGFDDYSKLEEYISNIKGEMSCFNDFIVDEPYRVGVSIDNLFWFSIGDVMVFENRNNHFFKSFISGAKGDYTCILYMCSRFKK